MPEYLAPGVYVEEVVAMARPIRSVGTSITALFGVAPKSDAYVRKPVLISNMSEFIREFLPEESTQEASLFATSVAGYFLNGGGKLYVVNLGDESTTISHDDMSLIDAIEDISLVAAPGYVDEASEESLISHCEARKDRFAVLDTVEKPDSINSLTKVRAAGGSRPRNSDKGVSACYAPWIETVDAITGECVNCAPSGHICGMYAAVDDTRGVHKAPANTPLRGALGLTHAISPSEQELLNTAGVNCIRIFEDSIRVWGARTLADASSEYRYVHVRRLVTMISQSIEQGTRWAVFEPNDLTLWNSLRREIGNFLYNLWRYGALMGAKSEDAYFVKCDSLTTTQTDIDNGRVIALIGIAPVNPAEFVIIRIGLSVDQS